MRKLYPSEQETQDLFNRDDNRATKQDIQDLSVQIAATNQTLQNTIDNLQSLQSSLAESLNTNEITAVNAAISMLQAASANLTSASATNLTVEELATLDELTANLATIANNLTVGGDANITGDVTAANATFENLTATSATIANWTIDNLTTGDIEATNISVSNDLTASEVEVEDALIVDNTMSAKEASIRDATIDKATIAEETVALAKVDETAIENIHWLYWQTYTADSPKLFMVLPHFENGIYFLRAKDGNQNTLFTVEVHNSIDNLFARWSQKEMNWVYKISKVGTGASTQCMLEVHNIDNVAFNLEYATICATPNVPAPTTYTTQPYPGNPMYKVSHQDGNKFFQNVDLANEGTTGAGLTMYATSNWALATTYYNYDGTMGVMSYNYLPNQSLNTGDNVEFYGLQVHDFSTTNLNVPGTLKAKHIYDGPQLTAAEKAALPDDTLLIEEGTTSGMTVPAVALINPLADQSSMARFIDGHKWAKTTDKCEEGEYIDQEYPGAEIDWLAPTWEDYNQQKMSGFIDQDQPHEAIQKYIVRNLDTNERRMVYWCYVVGSSTATAYHTSSIWTNQYNTADGTFTNLRSDIHAADESTFNWVDPDAFGDSQNLYDMNDELMSATRFNNLNVGDTYRIKDFFGDYVTYIVEYKRNPAMGFLVAAKNGVPYTTSGGNGKLNRKTTKSGAVQVKPLVPFNDDADPATDARPLVYDRTSDTIKKATGDLALPGDLAVAGDETVTGDLTVAGSLNAKDVEFDGNIKAEDLILTGDLEVENEAMFRHDVSISGDLYVDGVEHISDSETTQSSGDYMILRHNNPIPLGTNEKSGIAVHNYKTGGTATLSVDHEGTWRLADNTATSTMHTDLYYYDGKYYDTSFVEQTFVDQIKTAFDEDEIGDCVFYNSDSFYHFDGTHWYAVTLVNNKLITDETEVTDAALITALNALTKGPLQYFRKLEITTINEIENEAIFTRDEEANMADKALVQWDAATSKAKTIPLPTMNNQALTAQVTPAQSGIDAHLIKVRGTDYTRYPGVVYTGTIPEDATVTPEEVDGSDKPWYYSESLGYILNEYPSGQYVAIFALSYDSVRHKWNHVQAGTYDNLPEDAIEIDTPTAAYYYKAAVPASTTYQWKSNVGGGGLSFVGTRAQYNAAKLIPEGQDGYIGPNTLVTITDEDDFVTGDER